MPVSTEFREFVVDQLRAVAPVTAKAMFGGVGLYADGHFFALIADDVVYFKVDDSNRADFVAAGSRPFMPYGEEGSTMNYYELPPDVLEDPERLRRWMEKSIEVARRQKKKRVTS
ncbi:MAG TPA: TfoX/Sxy family protein [Thermoanaerobaculia bacterium]|nr:TfoX/Sxy family protein [Thermoanaerobaculia bacterium]